MSHTFLKNIFYIPAFLLGLPHEGVIALTILIIIDVLTGVLKVARIQGARAITSRSFASGILFKCLIVMIPIVIAIAGKGIGVDLSFMAKGALSMLVLSETYSIIGNIYSIKTGKEEKEFDAVSYSINKVRETVLSLLTKK